MEYIISKNISKSFLLQCGSQVFYQCPRCLTNPPTSKLARKLRCLGTFLVQNWWPHDGFAINTKFHSLPKDRIFFLKRLESNTLALFSVRKRRHHITISELNSKKSEIRTELPQGSELCFVSVRTSPKRPWTYLELWQIHDQNLGFVIKHYSWLSK